MKIEERILFQNSHWGENKFETFPMKRFIYKKIWKDIDTKLIGLITGGRRVGKSVIIKQLANDLITGKLVKPRQILFFEFSPKDGVDTIWKVFKYFSREVCDPRLPVYLLFDEIQYVDGYEVSVKEIYDNSKDTKIYLTGSLSLSYKRRMEESLAGRFFQYKLYPLNFEEYLMFTNKENQKLFKQAVAEKDKFKKQNFLKNLNPEFRKFLEVGRFPEVVNFDENQAKLYLKNIVTQSLNQDVFSYFDIQKPQIINALFEYFQKNCGAEVSVNKLSKDIGASNQTITEYINILTQMSLIYSVYNTLNPLIKSKVNKKIYLNSSFALLEPKTNLQSAMGFAVESYILERLLNKGELITFWRKRNKEIDFILPKKKVGFEVKFRSNAPQTNIQLKGFKIKTVSLDGKIPACLF